jgi:hypothetical protein
MRMKNQKIGKTATFQDMNQFAVMIRSLSRCPLSQISTEQSIGHDLMDTKGIAMVMRQFSERIIEHALKFCRNTL